MDRTIYDEFLLISDFMYPGGDFEDCLECKYHTSFDWLIPVIEKIEKIQEKEFMAVEVAIIGNECSIGIHKDVEHYHGLICNECSTKLESVYKSVVEFIKWHKLNYGTK